MFRQIFLSVIIPQRLNKDIKLSLNFTTKDTKMRKKLIKNMDSTSCLFSRPYDVFSFLCVIKLFFTLGSL